MSPGDRVGQGCEPVILQVELPEAVEPADDGRQRGEPVIHEMQLSQVYELADGICQLCQLVVIQAKLDQAAVRLPMHSGKELKRLSVMFR